MRHTDSLLEADVETDWESGSAASSCNLVLSENRGHQDKVISL